MEEGTSNNGLEETQGSTDSMNAFAKLPAGVQRLIIAIVLVVLLVGVMVLKRMISAEEATEEDLQETIEETIEEAEVIETAESGEQIAG
jgi:L-cystine uptake protein TcyP (sodium:dicarboxylate symporter family)